MRESKAYINFFKRNWLFLIVPGLIGAMIGVAVQINKPIKYYESRVLEMGFTQNNIGERIALTDQVTTFVREGANRRVLSLDPGVVMVAYKSAPLLINLRVEGSQKESLGANLSRVEKMLVDKYDLQPIGSDLFETEVASLLIGFLIGLFAGLSTGILGVLIKEYTDNF